MLDDRHCDVERVGFLEVVCADQVGVDLVGECDECD